MIALSAGIVIALANLVLRCPLERSQEWVRIGSLAAAASCAVLVDLSIVRGDRGGFDLLPRLAGAAGILAACGCLSLAVLAHLNRHRKPRLAAGEIRECVLFCPACGRKQSLPAGEARCDRCGLGIGIRFFVPDRLGSPALAAPLRRTEGPR